MAAPVFRAAPAGLVLLMAVPLMSRRFPLRLPDFLLLALAAVGAATCGGDGVTTPQEGQPAAIALVSSASLSGTVGQSLADSVIVRVTDSKGRPVQDQAVAFAVTSGGSSAMLQPDTVMTGSDGQAATRWTLGLLAGIQTAEARVVGFPALKAGFSAQAAPNPASRLALTTQPPGAAQSGAALDPAPVVQLEDDNGNPVAHAGQDVTVSLIGAGTLSGPTSITSDAAGQAMFSGLAINGRPATYRLAFSAAGLVPDTSTTITLLSGTATTLAFIGQPSNATAGVGITPDIRVEIQDNAGNPVSSTATVHLALGNNPGGDPMATVSVAAVGGVATFSGVTLQKAGSGYTLVASSTGLASATSTPFDVTAAAAAALTFTQQPSNVVAASAITPAVRVTLLDPFGNVATGSSAAVTMAIGTNPAGGVLSGTTSVNASSGVATFTNLKIDKPGTGYTLVAGSSGLASVTSTPFDVQVGTGNKVAFGVQPSNTTAGNVISPAVTVQVQDAAGNLDPTATNQVTVFLGQNPGNGHLSGTLQKNAVNGVATFSNLGIDSAGTGYTLSAAATGLVSAESNRFNILTGPPATIGIVTQPSSTVQNGVPFPTPPSVVVRDQSGNAVSGQVVTASLASGSGISLFGASATTNSSGVATFGGISASGTAGTFSLHFQAGSAVSAATGSITLTAGAPASVSITQQPVDTATSGVVFPQQPAVVVKDGAGNPVAGQSVTASIASGSGTLSGTLTLTTSSAGTAAWSNLAITGAGNYTLQFTAGSAVSPQSSTIVVIGVPASVTITTQPSSTVQVGVVFPTVPQVRVQDALGKNIKNQAVALAVASGGALTITQGTAVTGPNGIAVFTGLSVVGLAGTRTFQFTAGGVTSAPSAPVSVTAGAPSSVVVTTQPSAAVQAGVPFPVQPAVTVTDVGTNPVPSQTVTAAIASGAGTLAGALTATTNSSGVATFSSLEIDGATGTRTLSFTAGSANATSAGISVGPGLASASHTTASVPAGAAGSATAVTVTAKDAFDNPLTTGGATVGVAVSGANIATPAVNDNGDGTYGASYTPTKSGTDNVAITLNGSAISGSPYSSAVSAGPPVASTSTGNVPSSVTAGNASIVTVTSRDVYGNLETTGGATVVVTVSGANSAAPAVTDNGDGTYSASYTPTVSGTDTVAIALNGGSISGSPFSTTINPGPLDPASSTASVPSSGTHGVPVIITIQEKDQFGNDLAVGTGTVTVTVTESDASTINATVSPLANGGYTANYTPLVTGADSVAITINGVHITGSPFAITIN